ncbi:hypothetical protein HanPSC8_Chr04g0155741 [Helianthus annuus]|nr:hypothetical protein HanPSC8_Chr04g0155741 [Helianthus annuus]
MKSQSQSPSLEVRCGIAGTPRLVTKVDVRVVLLMLLDVVYVYL